MDILLINFLGFLPFIEKEYAMFSLKLLKVVPLISLMVLCSCASRPANIPATEVPHEKYLTETCSQLETKLASAKGALATVSEKQNSKANKDAWLIILSIVPISKVTGDHAQDIANLKGEIQAIEKARTQKQCK